MTTTSFFSYIDAFLDNSSFFLEKKPAEIEALMRSINTYDASTEKWSVTDRHGRQETYNHYVGTKINSDMTAEQIIDNLGYWKESKYPNTAKRSFWKRVETFIIEVFFLKHREETEAAIRKLIADRNRRHGKAHYKLVIIDGEVKERSEWVEKLPVIPEYFVINTTYGYIAWYYSNHDDDLPAFDDVTGKAPRKCVNQYEWYVMILRTMKGERIF